MCRHRKTVLAYGSRGMLNLLFAAMISHDLKIYIDFVAIQARLTLEDAIFVVIVV